MQRAAAVVAVNMLDCLLVHVAANTLPYYRQFQQTAVWHQSSELQNGDECVASYK
jgi:hypothetical protein